MIVLDTNVISGLMRPRENAAVVDWINVQSPDAIWTTAITIMEIRYGLDRMAEGKLRRSLDNAFGQLLGTLMVDRILAFDHRSAERAATLSARLHAAGDNIDQSDSQIAGIALDRGAQFATRNMRHFRNTGLHLINPWDAASPD